MAQSAGAGLALQAQAAGGLRAALVLAAEVVEVEGAVGAVAVEIAFGAAAEGMTIYMTLPALVFGAIFLVAALLTLLAGSS